MEPHTREPAAPARRREPAQILVLFALFVTVLLVLAGSIFDYGAIVLEDARFQNAMDAAALAGAQSLAGAAAYPRATQEAIAQRTSVAMLARNGYATQTPGVVVQVSFPLATPTPGQTPAAGSEIVLAAQKRQPTAFWPLVGINQVELNARAAAQASRTMADIMLSLDLTGSMELSGTNDLPNLRDAVESFVNQINPSASDPRGAKIGIARFAGVRCTWYWNGPDQSFSGSLHPDGDRYISLDKGEYVTPCQDDKTVLTNLTTDKDLLLKLAQDRGPAACPAGASAYACPLKHAPFNRPPVIEGPPGDTRTVVGPTPVGLSFSGIRMDGSRPTYSGTKLPNAMSVVRDSATGYDAWSAASGGRLPSAGPDGVPGTADDVTGARRVLVMMTDGQNEAWPRPGNDLRNCTFIPDTTCPSWDNELVQRATELKLGPDGVAGSADDVEIYVIGFFCTTSSCSWARSDLAKRSAPRACPGPALPGSQASAIDMLLIQASSSASGTCDHYFPINKSIDEELPQVFRTIAGAIARGRLTR